jgi:hypothetical protein
MVMAGVLPRSAARPLRWSAGAQGLWGAGAQVRSLAGAAAGPGAGDSAGAGAPGAPGAVATGDAGEAGAVGRRGREGRPLAFSPEFRPPSVSEAAQCPRKFRQASNEAIFSLAIHGSHGARRERLVREVMRQDNVDWVTARTKVEAINTENDKYGWVVKMPYQAGLLLGISGALASVPLTFHKPTVVWFAEHVVNMKPEDM